MMDGMTYEERAQIAENRVQKLAEQIERLIMRGIVLADYTDCLNLASINWYDEVKLARELIK